MALGGCSSMRKSGERVNDLRPDRVEVAAEREDMKRAAQAPLYDFNLMRDEIPEPLANMGDVYAPPPPPGCENMRREIATLSAILGPDAVLTEGEGDNVWTLDASDALESAMTSFIPFNDIIRYISGANDHQKRLARAYFRGQIRRAYLRGWSSEQGCHIPRPRLKPRYTDRNA